MHAIIVFSERRYLITAMEGHKPDWNGMHSVSPGQKGAKYLKRNLLSGLQPVMRYPQKVSRPADLTLALERCPMLRSNGILHVEAISAVMKAVMTGTLSAALSATRKATVTATNTTTNTTTNTSTITATTPATITGQES